MDRPLAAHGDEEVVGSKGLVMKDELVRIITATLHSLGYSRTANSLKEESGIDFASPEVKMLLENVINGKQDGVSDAVRQIGSQHETAVKNAIFLVRKFQILELLAGGNTLGALDIARTQISDFGEQRDHELIDLILFPDKTILDGSINLRSMQNTAQNQLRRMIPSTMVPENRLVYLIEQAIISQLEACEFHNSPIGNLSLLTDHNCGKDQIPSRTLEVLSDHSGEVWFLEFSHNGKYMASSGTDCVAILWEVKVGGKFSVLHKLVGHEKPVSLVSWSHNDSQLLTCGMEETVRRWDAVSGECLWVYRCHDLGLVSCDWAPDGNSIIFAANDKSIFRWYVQGTHERMNLYQSTRLADLRVIKDREELVYLSAENVLSCSSLATQGVRCIVEEDQPIVSFALSEDARLMLVSVLNQELHLWGITRNPSTRLGNFSGHIRSRYSVRCCFGGVDQNFIASGSEDSQVYIWHKGSEKPISVLSGHSAVVNCVNWNPADPQMLASASDDGTIRIWGT